MRKIKYFIFICGFFILISCQKKSPTESPPDNNTHPQVDIPWPSLADSPWPMHHHDPQSTGRSPFVGPQRGEVTWKFSVDGPVGTSVAIAPDSTIYFASSYDTTEGDQTCYLYALNWNGKLKWKTKIFNTFGTASQCCSPLVAADGTIYIGSSDCFLYAINPDGSIKWKYLAEDKIVILTLNINLDGTIYFVDRNSLMYAVNPDGTLKWKTDGYYKFCYWSYGISISPDGMSIYTGCWGTAESDTNTGLVALNTDGQIKWLFLAGEAGGTPLVDNDGNIFFATENSDTAKSGIFSVSPQGKLRWKYSTNWINNLDITMDYNGNIYFGSGESDSYYLISCDNEGSVRWELDIAGQNHLRSSIICDREGTTFFAVGSPHQQFLAVNSQGQVMWQSFFGEINGNSPALSEGNIFFGTWYRDPGRELYCIK